MTTSRVSPSEFKRSVLVPIRRLPIATGVLLGLTTFALIIAIAWFSGDRTISDLFAHFNAWQETPPSWLSVPITQPKYLLLPTIILVSVALLTIRICPVPTPNSRVLVVGILLALALRYTLWRSLSTLNLSNPLNGVLSLTLFFLEMLLIISSSIQLYLMLRVKDRRRQADRMALAVENGLFVPAVDILIPTYNEPAFILKRTIVGCQALDYPNKKVYLLDDTKRWEIKKLATELGCEYITRPDNLYAKAGNLNHALAQTKSPLIAVFDADFIPTKNFLTRTVGFFQDERVALVQTPQSFYNPDPIARNLGLENTIAPEEEVFYRQIELIKDGANSVICSGTSFVVRRTALEKTGGFVTESICEDYFTGIRLSAKGYHLIYLDEKLSAGLAAENIAAHLTQRMRWARGTLQAFFIDSNPLTIRGLTPIQRLSHLEGLLHWFTSLTRLFFLLMPLAYSFLGVIPFRASVPELLYFYLPYYLLQVLVFAWLNHRSRSAILSDLYFFVQCFPLSMTIIHTMLNPFGQGFKVTPKGTISDRFRFNWNLAWPLLILLVATAFSLYRNISLCLHSQIPMAPDNANAIKGIGLGWVWSSYNLLMIAIALLILIDVPKPDINEWFQLRRIVGIKTNDRVLWGITTLVSEAGMEIELTQSLPKHWESMPLGILSEKHQVFANGGEFKALVSQPVTLKIMEEKLELQGKITQINSPKGVPSIRIMFESVSLSQHRHLIEMLFCRPGQWKRHQTPSELRSLWLLLKILIKPRVLFDKHKESKSMAILQG